MRPSKADVSAIDDAHIQTMAPTRKDPLIHKYKLKIRISSISAQSFAMLACWGPKPLLEPQTSTARKSPPPEKKVKTRKSPSPEKKVKTDAYEKHVGGWLPVLWDAYDPPEVEETF